VNAILFKKLVASDDSVEAFSNIYLAATSNSELAVIFLAIGRYIYLIIPINDKKPFAAGQFPCRKWLLDL